jgi:hypothetical protein
MAIRPPGAAPAASTDVVVANQPATIQPNPLRPNPIATTIRPSAGGGIGKPAAAPAQQWNTKGTAGFDRAKTEKTARANKTFPPRRFFVPVGEQREIILLDSVMEELHWDHEHALYDPNAEDWRDKWKYYGCPSEQEKGCPLCAGARGKSFKYYNLKLTALVLKSWTDKDGVVHEYSYELLMIKDDQTDLFNEMRMLHGAGTFRGLHLKMVRANKSDPTIGRPMFHGMHSEQDIIEFAQHPAIISNSGQLIVPKNGQCYPINYKKFFPKPTVAALIQEFGAHHSPGSVSANQETLKQAGMTDGEDSIPY